MAVMLEKAARIMDEIDERLMRVTYLGAQATLIVVTREELEALREWCRWPATAEVNTYMGVPVVSVGPGEPYVVAFQVYRVEEPDIEEPDIPRSD